MGKKPSNVLDLIRWGREARRKRGGIEPIEGGRPTCEDVSIDLASEAPHAFVRPEFPVVIGGGRTLVHLRVGRSGGGGRLELDGVVVAPQQIVSVRDLYAGRLVFVPDGAGASWFEFEAYDGAYYSVSAARMTICVAAGALAHDVMQQPSLCEARPRLWGQPLEELMSPAARSAPAAGCTSAVGRTPATRCTPAVTPAAAAPAAAPIELEPSAQTPSGNQQGGTAGDPTAAARHAPSLPESVRRRPSRPAVERRHTPTLPAPWARGRDRSRTSKVGRADGRLRNRRLKTQSRLSSARRRKGPDPEQ